MQSVAKDLCYNQSFYKTNNYLLEMIRKIFFTRGWLGGSKVLRKLSVPGRPTTLDYSRVRAYCACSRCG